MSRRFKITWFIISFLFGLCINELNLCFVKKENPSNITANEKSTMYGYTVYNVDHEWYLPQIRNILSGNGYTLDPKEPELRVRRTPLYPLFYGLHYFLFGEEESFFVIRYTQLFLLSLACILLGLSVLNFTSNLQWSKWTSMLFAFSPFIFINAYHTVTESLTPFLVVFCIWIFSRYYSGKKNKFLLLTGLALGLTILNRPVTGILLPCFLLALLEKPSFKFTFVKNYLKQCGLMLMALLLALSPWIMRNYFVTNGEIIFLEKVYHEDPMDFGRGHIYFRNWIACWENPATISAEEFSNALRNNIKRGKLNNDPLIDHFILSLPEKAFIGNSKGDIKAALQKLNDCFVEKQNLKDEDPLITRKDLSDAACEEEVKSSFSLLAEHFKTNSPANYFILTPFKLLKSGIMQSNSLFFGSLNPTDKKFSAAQIIIKSGMYLLNLILFLSAFVFLFSKKSPVILKIMIISFILFNLLLYSEFIRYLDARYLLPLYPFLYITLSYYFHLVTDRNKTKA